MGTLRPRLDTLDSEIVLGSGVWDWIELWTQLPWIKWEVFLKIAKEKGVFSRGGKKTDLPRGDFCMVASCEGRK